MYTKIEKEIPTQSKFAHIPNHMQIFPWILTNPSLNFHFLFSTNLSLKYIFFHTSQWGEDQFLERSKGGDSFGNIKMRFPKVLYKKKCLKKLKIRQITTKAVGLPLCHVDGAIYQFKQKIII